MGQIWVKTSKAGRQGVFKRGGFAIRACPSLSFLVLFPIFPGFSRFVRGFSRSVLFLFLGLLTAPTRNSLERVRDRTWTFPDKSGKPPGLETPWFTFSQNPLSTHFLELLLDIDRDAVLTLFRVGRNYSLEPDAVGTLPVLTLLVSSCFWKHMPSRWLEAICTPIRITMHLPFVSPCFCRIRSSQTGTLQTGTLRFCEKSREGCH